MIYQDALRLFEQGNSLRAIGKQLHISVPVVVDLLRVAGLVCADCDILLVYETDGIALVDLGEITGPQYVCQDCVERADYRVLRWAREAREYVSVHG